MNSIAFVPASRALFIADSASESSSGMQHNALLQRIKAQGLSTQARMLLPGTELAYRSASGVMVELIDVLPILADPASEPALAESRELTALSSQPLVTRVRALLGEDLANMPDLDAVASRCCMSSRTLKRPDDRAVEVLVQRIVYGKLHLGQLGRVQH
mgnify:CR=1 FL=1